LKLRVAFAGRTLLFSIPLNYAYRAISNLRHVLVDCDYFQAPWAIPSSVDVVVDAGAFLGFYTVAVATLTSKGLVHAIEPDPRTAPLLRVNVELNKLWNARVLPIAICPESGYTKLHLAEYPALSSLVLSHVELHDRVVGAVDVKCVKLSSLLEHLGRVDILKLDVEGVERDLLKEARDSLWRVKSLVVELHEDVVEVGEIEELVESAGFKTMVLYKPHEMVDQTLLFAKR
jgi:FkbM family methyltransferase